MGAGPGRAGALRKDYLRSSASTRTMRWALAEVSGAPAAFSTETVLWLPSLRTTMRYLSGAEASGERASPRWRDGSILADDALLIRAAIAGQGLAVVRDIYAADELAAGRLIRVLVNTAPTADAYFLVARPDRMAQQRAKAFRDWLLGAVEAFAAGN